MRQMGSRWMLAVLITAGLAGTALAGEPGYVVGGGGPSFGLFMPKLTEINEFVGGAGFAPFDGYLLLAGGSGRGGVVPGPTFGGGGWGAWIESWEGDLRAEYEIGLGGLDLGLAVGGNERSVLTLGALLGGGGAELVLTEYPPIEPFGVGPQGIVIEPTQQTYDSAFAFVAPYVDMQVQLLDWLGLGVRAGYVWAPFELNWHDEGPLEPPDLSPSGWYVRFSVVFGGIFSTEPVPAARPLGNLVLADFEAYIEQIREFLNVPGVAVAIVQGGEIVYAKGFGVKEIGRDDPVTADTVFSIGSTTKALTSMMVASLVDDGLIEWDTPLVEVMPQFQLSDEQATQQITLREALGMTTGLPKLGLFSFSERSPEDYVEYLADVPLAAPPGESYVYQNEMYTVGAYAAAMAAGAEYGENLFSTYADLMQERVFDPLGMTSATFSAQEAGASPNHATPHFMSLNATLAETGFDVTPTDYVDMDAIAPAGTARMSARDVGRFLITMLSGGVTPGGSRAISTENLAETWTEQISVEPFPHIEQDGYGMGWHPATYQGISLVTHNGGIGGFSSEMAFIPEADIGIVVLANADYLGSTLRTQVHFRLIEMLLGLEPFIDEGFSEGIGSYLSALSDGYSQLAAVDPETVAPFLGGYNMEGATYTVELRDDRLWVSIGVWDYIELLAAPDGSYAAISGGEEFIGAPFQFVEADDGRITMVIFGELEVPKLD